jgi:hypothetical protein
VPQRQHGHSITGVILTPTPTKPLAGMVINKPSDGHYLVLGGGRHGHQPCRCRVSHR